MAIVAAFVVYLVLIIFMGLGIYRIWRQMVPTAGISWALLPGTVVSEMAYILGCLIAGGEIRHARLVPGRKGPRGGRGESEPRTEATPKLKVIGPLIAAVLAIVACGGAILLCNWMLGDPVMDELVRSGWLVGGSLPKDLPGGWLDFWLDVKRQIDLVQWSCETFGEVDWLDWRVPLFTYLAMCLSVRLAPVGRDMRASLGAVVLIAVVIVVVGLISNGFRDLMNDLWPLLTYVYATLLLMLLLSLVARGLVGLVRIVAGKTAAEI